METSWIPDGGRVLQALGWTLIHSLWQATVVYALLSILLRSFPAMPARLRYASGLLALGAIGAWSIHTLYRHWPAAHSGIATGSYRAGHSSAEAPDLLLLLNEAMPWLMMVYGLGLGLMLGRLMLGISEVGILRRSGMPMDGEPAKQLAQLARAIGLRRPVALRQSPAVAVPMVIGMLRPVILLPYSCIETLSPAALETILLHELAHIRRGDYLVNIMQRIIEALLFFNPFVRRISAMLRREREHCCDDLVLRHSGRPFEYATALASLVATAQKPALALGAADSSYPLLNRIKRITTMENKPMRTGTVIVASGIAALLIAVSIVCFTPAFAQNKTKQQKPVEHTMPPAPPAPSATIAPPAAPVPPAAPAAPAAAAIRNSFSAIAESEELFRQLPAIIDSAFSISGEAMSQVDWDKIRSELRSASKEIAAIDWSAIRRETQAAMTQASKEIDWKAIDRDVKTALAEARHTIDVELDEVDHHASAGARNGPASSRRALADSRRELADSKAEAAREAREEQREAIAEMRAAQREIEAAKREMEAARREMEQARKELERARSAR